MNPEPPTSSGVQQLIDRLHQEGVSKGKDEADELVSAARQQAADILDEARRQADVMLASAREEADRIRSSGEEAVRLAGRDTVLNLTEELQHSFQAKLQQMVVGALADSEYLRGLIKTIVDRALPDASGDGIHVELLSGANAGREGDEFFSEESLDKFVKSLTTETLCEGVTLGVRGDRHSGLRVHLMNDNVQVDLTDQSVTDLLLSHVSQRLQSILQSEA